MPVTTFTSTRRPASRGRARVRAPHVAARGIVMPTGPDAATVSARREGGPQDFALYLCSCGSSFDAPVSACVGCPVCGAAQDW